MTRTTGFAAIEALQEASREAGWDVQYRQLERGQLIARTATSMVGDIALIDEYASRSLEVAASSPDEHITVFVPFDESVRISINGRTLDTGSVLLMPTGDEFYSVTDGATRLLSMHIPKALLIRHLMAEGLNANQRDVSTLRMISCGSWTAGLRRALLQALTASGDPVELDPGLLAGLSAAIRESVTADAGRGSLLRRSELAKALDYIEEHLEEPIRIATLCEIAGASRSTLERSFRGEFATTPLAYVRARKLDAVRRELVASDAPIADIAVRYGFYHLGRFSASFCEQFGVLPSNHRKEFAASC